MPSATRSRSSKVTSAVPGRVRRSGGTVRGGTPRRWSGPGAKVGQLLFNGPEFFETYHGALKIRAVPFNINFRYTAEEISYLLDNSDAEALVYHSSLAEVVAEVLERGPKLRLVVEVDDGGEHLDGSIPMEDVAGRPMLRLPA